MEQVTNAILTAAQFHSKLTGEPVNEDFTRQIKQLGTGIFRLVVMGEIKKGKSSFINAFLGVKDLVPVASDIATSTVYKIHYGQEPAYRVFFEQSAGKAPLRITKDELAAYGTENGNPGNIKQVDFIEVAYPAPLLKTGLVIIDTPGLGGLYKEHKKITWNYVPKADAVFFVTDSVESPIGLEEIQHLKTVLNITPHLYFVQTKASAVDKEAREARRQNNLSILSRAFNTQAEQIPYFVVDSLRKFSADESENLKKLERSGYPELMSYINSKLLLQKHRILACKAATLATPILTAIRNDINARKGTIAADTVEKQKQAKDAITEAENQLQEWQTERLPELRITISRRFDELKTECENMCAQLRPNGQIHAQIDEIINEVENIEQLGAVIEVLRDKLPETASGCMNEVRTALENGVADIMKILYQEAGTNNTAIRVGTSSQQGDKQMELTENNYMAQVYQGLSETGNAFNHLRSAFMGSSIGTSVGYTLGSIAGSIIPGLGTAIGGMIGGIIGSFWGSYAASSDVTMQELKQAKAQTANAINKSISSMYSDIMTGLRELFKQFNHQVEDALNKALRQHTRELRKAHAELVERARMSATEITTAKNKLAQDEAQLRSILKALEPWMPAPAKKA